MPYKDVEKRKQCYLKYKASHGEELLEYQEKYRGKHKHESSAYYKLYYKSHKDDLNQINKKYYYLHKDAINTQKKEYAKLHVDQHNQANRRYRLENYDNYIASTNKYRRSEKGKITINNIVHSRRCLYKTTDITHSWLCNLKLTSIICSLCGDPMNNTRYDPKQKHLDHIIPLNPKCGGLHIMSNVRYICATCNLTRPRDGSDIHKVVEDVCV